MALAESPVDDDIPSWQSNETFLSYRTRQSTTSSSVAYLNTRSHKLPETPTALVDKKTNNVNQPQSVQEIIYEQSTDDFCKTAALSVGITGSQYSVDKSRFLIRQASIDGALQMVVPKSLQVQVLHLSHHPVLSGHPGQRRMYHTLHHNYYWPQIAKEIYELVDSCAECRRR